MVKRTIRVDGHKAVVIANQSTVQAFKDRLLWNAYKAKAGLMDFKVK